MFIKSTREEGGVKKLTASIPDQLDKRLRDYTETKHQGVKGALSIVVIDAIEEYLKARAR
jgi:hypothetical protein